MGCPGQNQYLNAVFPQTDWATSTACTASLVYVLAESMSILDVNVHFYHTDKKADMYEVLKRPLKKQTAAG